MRKKKPYNAGDPKHVAAQEGAEKEQVRQHLKDLRKILDTPEGIRVFAKIIEDGKVFSSSFTGNSTTFFNEGMRNLALKIFADICEAAPNKVQLIILKTKEKSDG